MEGGGARVGMWGRSNKVGTGGASGTGGAGGEGGTGGKISTYRNKFL